MNSRRLEKQKKILNVIEILDKTKKNLNFYQQKFLKMNDKEFDNWLKDLKSGKEVIRLETIAYENEPSLEDIEKAANYLKLPLEEYVYFNHEKTEDGLVPRSYAKVPVGYIPIRRMQQILAKKNSYTTDINQRSAITGQVTGDSKIAKISDSETSPLLITGGQNGVKEFLSFRADNKNLKKAAYNEISRYGYVSMEEIKENDSMLAKSTLNTVDVYFLIGGLKTNLVTSDNKLINPEEEKEKNKIKEKLKEN
jgi:hypothetical protein